MVRFVHPLMGHTTESMQRSLYAHLAVFSTLSTLVMSMRLYARHKARSIGYEDYAIAVSWIFATAHSGLVINEVKNGLGNHIQDLTPTQLTNIMESFYFVLICYTVAIGSFKVSVLLQYLRIFNSPRFRLICFGSIAVVVMFILSFVIVAIFQCRPVHFFWDRMIPGGVCMNPASVWVTMNAINITTDLFIFILPLPPIYQLTFPGRMKICLMVVFALGFFVVLMSIIRLPSVYVICTSIDLPYYSTSATIWTIIELNTAIICASMPALRVLGASFIQRFVSSTRRLATITTGWPVDGGSQRLPSSHKTKEPVGSAGSEPWDAMELPTHGLEKAKKSAENTTWTTKPTTIITET